MDIRPLAAESGISMETLDACAELMSAWQDSDEPDSRVVIVAIAKALREPSVALVRELAESDPTIYVGEMGDAQCRYCHSQGRHNGQQKHLPTCLWLRARKMAGMG